MPGALIVIDQDRPSGTSFGSPGLARNDLWLSRIVRPRCGISGNTSFLWSLLAIPPTSTVTLNNPTTATPDFDPDVSGNYRLQLVTNGGGPGNVQILVCSVRHDVNGVLASRGWALPAFGETSAEDNFGGQTRGYAQAFEFILTDILNILNTPPPAGTVEVQEEGTLVSTRGILNFIGTAVTAVDNPGFNRVDITVTASPGTDVNGATIPAAGSLTTDHIVKVLGSAALTYGFLVDANVDPSAAISGSKISPNFGSQPVVTTGAGTFLSLRATGLSTGISHVDGSGNLTSSLLVNADVDAAAAIDGTKVSPNFGSQAVTTTSLGTFGGVKTTGGRIRHVRSVTTTGAITTSDDVVAVGTTVSGITLELPAAPADNYEFTVVDTAGTADVRNITIDANGSTIWGASTLIISTQYASVTVLWNGTDWSVI